MGFGDIFNLNKNEITFFWGGLIQKMDEFKFFREATLKICGSLEIEKALQATLLYLQKYLPVDRMNLQRFDPDFGTMHTIVTATANECKRLNVLIPVSREAKKTPRLNVGPAEDEMRIFNQPRENALCREMMKFLNLSCRAIMVMRLRLGQEILGSLVVITNSEKKYTGEHARLLSIIREPFVIALANTLAHQDVIKLKNLLSDDNKFLQSELRRISGENIIGANFGLKNVMHQVRQVAGLDSPVLLLGETGVGKDLIANAIHRLSPRNDKPFIAVNCGAIPENLIDSELFGHEKGAFTGALARKRGRFERANSGTIFLDEIGDMPLEIQAKVLRVLEDSRIQRVGEQKIKEVDFRVIAATNRDLADAVAEGEFREDLYFRLEEYPVYLPALRERNEDIPLLASYFLKELMDDENLKTLQFSETALEQLKNHAWPGNIRELKNVVRRSAFKSSNSVIKEIEFTRMGSPTKRDKKMKTLNKPSSHRDITPIEEMERAEIQKAYHFADKNAAEAARLLGISRATMYRKLKDYQVE